MRDAVASGRSYCTSRVALGSQAEMEVHLELANQLGFIGNADYERLQERANKIGRMLNRLIDRFREAATTND